MSTVKDTLNLLAVGGADMQEELRRALEAAGTGFRFVIRPAKDFRQGIDAVRNLVPDVVFLDILEESDRIGPLAKEILDLAPEAALVAVYRHQAGEARLDGGAVIEGMRAGVKDFLRRPVSTHDLKELLGRVLKEGPPKLEEAGKVLTVVSNKGGVGKSTLAVNLACGLARRHPGKVLLVDTSVQLGTLAMMLNLRPTTSLLDAVRQIDRLDETLLTRLAAHHPSGLHLLAAPREPASSGEITDETLSRILHTARRAYTHVVVDTFPMLDSLVMASLDLSDRIYVVVEGVVPTVDGCARLLRLLEEMGYPRARQRIVLNRYSYFAGNLPPSDIEERFQRKIDHVVPYTRQSLVAMNLGQPLILERANAMPMHPWLLRLADWMVRSRVQIPWILRLNGELQFVYEVERMVDEVEGGAGA